MCFDGKLLHSAVCLHFHLFIYFYSAIVKCAVKIDKCLKKVGYSTAA